MKGVVFVKLNEFIDQTFGFALWEELLDITDLPSKGIYTSIATYDDTELFALLESLTNKTGLHPNQAQVAFGKWLFKELYAMAPPEAHNFNDPFVFLKGVQNVIHVEVKKLNPDVILPEFKFLEETSTSLTFEYCSPRKMHYFWKN